MTNSQETSIQITSDQATSYQGASDQATSARLTSDHATRSLRLRVNPAACSGHGVCAELLPELITLDEWGYPLLAEGGVPARLSRQARRAVRDCPALALMISAPIHAEDSEETQKLPRRPA
jgi:ferredoxin